MNYIKHLTGFFERSANDTDMTSYHVSLYLSLFSLWNKSHFSDKIFINRGDLMRIAKIGSKTTYAKCIRELDEWGYIDYSNNSNQHKTSTVSMIPLDEPVPSKKRTRNEPCNGTSDSTSMGTRSGTHYINYKNNTNGQTKNRKQAQKNYSNGKEKNNTARFHVNNEKDYSEPL